MNRIFFWLLFFLLAAPPLSRTQWSEIKQNQVYTWGNAALKYSADRVRFNFTVIGIGGSLEEAVRQATGRVEKIAAKLKSVGVTENQLQTSYFNSAENREGKSWWTSSKDFAAAFDVTVTLDSFALIEPSIESLAGEPIERLSKLEFSLKDDSLKQMAALRAAAEDARAKAQLIANTLGASVTRVLYVKDMSSFSYGTISVEARASPSYVFSGKQIPVTARLEVYFELGYKDSIK